MNTDKAYNATRAGQMAMCHEAQKKGMAFMLNRKVKSLGGTGWDDSWIETANPTLLIAIKDNLIEEYNKLLGQPQVTK